MCQNVNKLGKTAISDAGCVFAYFCGGQENILRL